ncbi:unnamed protein product [Choristocarpus tenellus]
MNGHTFCGPCANMWLDKPGPRACPSCMQPVEKAFPVRTLDQV